eukprot:scaffold18977_cov76-Skeletonema_dohrnii-CCMP3373.AAC.4
MAMDSTFFWNMFFFGNMKMLLDILLNFGYNPMLESNLTRDKCTKVKEIQDYYLNEKDGAFELMRSKLWTMGSSVWRKKLGQMMGSGHGWSHLYEAKTDNYSQVNKADKFLVTLLLYVLNKVVGYQVLVDEVGKRGDNLMDVTKDELIERGLWMYGDRDFKVHEVIGKKRNGLRVCTKGDDSGYNDIDTPGVFIPVNTDESPTFESVVTTLFQPKDENLRNSLADGRIEEKAKLELHWVNNEQKGKKKGKRKRKTAVETEDREGDSSNDERIQITATEANNEELGKEQDDTIRIDADGSKNTTLKTASTQNDTASAADHSRKKQKRGINMRGVAASVAKTVMSDGSNFGALNVLIKVIEGGKLGQYCDLYNMLGINQNDQRRLSAPQGGEDDSEDKDTGE